MKNRKKMALSKPIFVGLSIFLIVTTLTLSLTAVGPQASTAQNGLQSNVVQIDSVQITFTVRYSDKGFRGYPAASGDKYVWITYTQVNKGTEPILGPLGNKYGVKVLFDLVPEQTLNIAQGVMLPPGDPLEGGVVLAIRVDAKVTQLSVYFLETGTTTYVLPILG